MNLEELKGALSAMADEVEGIDTASRLDQVQAKVHSNRRRKVAGIAVVAVCLVGVGVAAPFIAGMGNAPVQPANPPMGSLHTIDSLGYKFYTDAAGNKLLGEAVGDTGAHSVSLTVIPRSLNLGWVQICRGGGLRPDDVALTVNGHRIAKSVLRSPELPVYQPVPRSNPVCDGFRSPIQMQRVLVSSPAANAAAWRRLGVQPGHPATFRFTVGAKTHTVGPRLRLVLAVYQRAANVSLEHGFWVDREIVRPDETPGAYRLVGQAFRAATATGAITAMLPRSDRRLYVRCLLLKGARHGVEFDNGTFVNSGQVERENSVGFKPGYGIDELDGVFASGGRSVSTRLVVPPKATGLVAFLIYERYH